MPLSFEYYKWSVNMRNISTWPIDFFSLSFLELKFEGKQVEKWCSIFQTLCEQSEEFPSNFPISWNIKNEKIFFPLTFMTSQSKFKCIWGFTHIFPFSAKIALRQDDNNVIKIELRLCCLKRNKHKNKFKQFDKILDEKFVDPECVSLNNQFD